MSKEKTYIVLINGKSKDMKKLRDFFYIQNVSSKEEAKVLALFRFEIFHEKYSFHMEVEKISGF